MRAIYELLNRAFIRKGEPGKTDCGALPDAAAQPEPFVPAPEEQNRMALTEKEKAAVLAYVLSGGAGAENPVPEKSRHKLTVLFSNRKGRNTDMKNQTKYSAAAAAAAITLLAGGIVYAASSWSSALTGSLQIDSQQQETLEQSGATAFVNQSDTQEGITITAEQCIIDQNFAYLTFRVEGYELAEGEEPCFDSIDFQFDGESSWTEGGVSSGSGTFYDNLSTDAYGRAINADGSAITDEDFTETWVQEDGSLEYLYILYSSDEDFFSGKSIHVEISGLGTVYKAAFTPDVEATWTFDFELPQATTPREVSLNAALGDSGATVTQVRLSPISVTVLYDFELQEETETGYDENGNEIIATTFKEAPRLAGLRLKDGTDWYYVNGGRGSEGYLSGDDTTYTCQELTSRILDIDEVEGLLFYSSTPDGDETAEEDLYYVPLSSDTAAE